MKLIIIWRWSTPASHGVNVAPFEFESKEAAEQIWFERCERASLLSETFDFAGIYWSPSDHLPEEHNGYTFDLPEILTLEEWFEQEKAREV